MAQILTAKYLEIDVTPTVTASSAYASGKQVGGIQALTNACPAKNAVAQLQTLSIIDVDGQKAPLTILLFNQNPTVTSTDKQDFAITAANLKSQCIGSIAIAAADYNTAASGTAVVCDGFSNGFFKSIDTNGHLYAVAITTGTPTFSTTASLVFKWVFGQNYA